MGNLRGSMGIRWASGGASGDQGPCAPPGGRRRTPPWPVASDRRGCTNVKRVNNDRGRACGGFISLALEPKTTCRVGAISTPNLSAGNVSRPVQSTPIWRAAPRPRVHPGPTPGPPRAHPGRAAGRGAWRSGRARDGTAIPVAGAAGGVWRSARGIVSPGWHAHGHTTTPPGPPPGAAPRTPPPAAVDSGGGDSPPNRGRLDWSAYITGTQIGCRNRPGPTRGFWLQRWGNEAATRATPIVIHPFPIGVAPLSARPLAGGCRLAVGPARCAAPWPARWFDPGALSLAPSGGQIVTFAFYPLALAPLHFCTSTPLTFCTSAPLRL